MAESITARDVARIADVSVGTVSRVFNNHPNVTGDIRRRVLEVAQELGYNRAVEPAPVIRPNRALREIGFLYYSLYNENPAANPYWSHILHGVEREARAANIRVIYKNISDIAAKGGDFLNVLKEDRLGGMLIAGTTDRTVLEQLLSLQQPLVVVGHRDDTLDVDAVVENSFDGARLVVEHLIAHGHKRIAMIGIAPEAGPRPYSQVSTVEQRIAGYRMAMLDAGLPIVPELYDAGIQNFESGYQACQRLLAREARFSALFCANDTMAAGALKALNEAGMRVPEDVSLVGFDDIDLAEMLTPGLTTVRVNKERMGTLAVQQLIVRAANPDMPTSTSVMRVALVPRSSVAVYQP